MDTTTQPLSGCQRDIALVTGVTDPAELARIEDIMRAQVPTMDHLTTRELADLARYSHRYAQALAQAAVPRSTGDLVGCTRRPGRTYRIDRVNRESYGLVDVDSGQGVRAAKSLVTDPPGRLAEVPAAPPAAPARKVGELVGCSRRPGVTYRVVRVNRESYGLANVATGASLRASKSLVTDPPKSGV